MCDVAFGGDGPTIPLPLTFTSSPPIFTNLGPQQVRLIHDIVADDQWNAALPDANLSDQYGNTNSSTGSRGSQLKYHIYQYRNSTEQPWNSFYCFPEYQFYPPDFEIMNYFTSTNTGPTNFQTITLLVVKFVMDEGQTPSLASNGQMNGEKSLGKIVGKVMFVNEKLKRNDGGKTRPVLECGSEEERVRGLREACRIELTEEEINGIKGRNVEILGKVE